MFSPHLVLLVALLVQLLEASPSSYRPVVLWHGLGDSYSSAGMEHITELIQEEYPGIFVHSVSLAEDAGEDQKQSFFGDMNDHLDYVCEQLAAVPELAMGFDGIGFSQGGLFLRAYAERCNTPALRRLITYGSPHNGVSNMPLCEPTDFFCKRRNALFLSQVWTDYAQTHVVSAQYFRDPEQLDQYLEHSNFLADINNERSSKNSTYKSNLSQLELLVLVYFTEDETVIPKESAWFFDVNTTSNEVTPLEHRDLYEQDWLGLQSVDIVYLRIKGLHMQISKEDLQYAIKKYLGSVQKEADIGVQNQGFFVQLP